MEPERDVKGVLAMPQEEEDTTRTWDGLPIAQTPPFGASIVVYRLAEDRLELLVLHRSQKAFDEEWAWTPPSGARQPGETIDDCAMRELLEEAGRTLPLVPADGGGEPWAVFLAHAPEAAQVTLNDPEHDQYAWLSPHEALARCSPDVVRTQLARAIERIAPGATG